jgi:hypothetical protein
MVEEAVGADDDAVHHERRVPLGSSGSTPASG